MKDYHVYQLNTYAFVLRLSIVLIGIGILVTLMAGGMMLGWIPVFWCKPWFWMLLGGMGGVFGGFYCLCEALIGMDNTHTAMDVEALKAKVYGDSEIDNESG